MAQSELHDNIVFEYALREKWKAVAEALGITVGVCQTLRSDDGSSFGPTLREAVFYYCAQDAAAGINPEPGFECLTSGDYAVLNQTADHARLNLRSDTV